MSVEATEITDIHNKIQRAEENYKRQLEWITKTDTRCNIVIAILVGMVGFLANIINGSILWSWYIISTFIVFSISAVATIFVIILSQYPKIESPNMSLIYFNTIASLKNPDFVNGFKNLTDEEYLEDLLFQTHINANIVSRKINLIGISIKILCVSISFWTFFMIMAKIPI